MITLCVLFAIGVIALFVTILGVALATFGWCLKTLFALSITVAMCWIAIRWIDRMLFDRKT